MTTYLLDANVLIALVDRSHELQTAVSAWMAGVNAFATCPITEGSLVRYMVRNGKSPDTIQRLLAYIAQRAGFRFWPDTLPYRKVDLVGVIGHRQVTDAYLAALAEQHGAKLATLGQGLATLRPEIVELVHS
jgi:predicted nucleic acid-binding protein